ncbi:MAG: filamentous hemagglutinin N-terminal domain-containing protein, partial [Leptolyngbya sp. DLM2.Bin15]
MNYRLCGYGGSLLLALWSGMAIAPRSVAQSITPANDGTGTEVRQVDGRFDIDGGQRSRDGRNLFHSFEQFGLDEAQIANFLSQPEIDNILGRVVGGSPSIIQGILQVSGGASNVYLMNPAGIVFGETASLNIPASFTATTADRVDFAEGWWMMGATPVYQDLVGDPTAFRFGPESSAAIVNAGILQVLPGENLTLLGGTVVSTGQLIAPGGTITLATVPGGNVVRMSQPGQVLSLEIQPVGEGEITEVPEIAIASLPQLLTSADIGHAQGVTVMEDGTVYLNGSGIAIAEGDLAVQQLAGQEALLSSGRTISLVESELMTDGDLFLLATDTLTLRDSLTTPLVIQAGGDLILQGDRSVDILALNHPAFPLQSGGLFQLISDGVISTDAHFVSGGAFSILDLSGQPASFVSLYDPIISADGDVQFGDYTGAALLVEATGSIEGGTINITQPDLTYSVIPDWEIVGVGRVEFSNYDTANADAVPAQAIITTRNLDGGNGLNNAVVTAAELEAFLGLNPDDLSSLDHGAAINGSGIRTTITVEAGDIIRLNWQFFTDEFSTVFDPSNDFAVVSLSGPEVSITNLANADTPDNFTLNAGGVNQSLDNFRSDVGDSAGTAMQTIEIPVTIAGTYTLGIAVVNAVRDGVSSSLLIDSVTPNPITVDDRSLLASTPALILRAGVESLQYAPNVPQLGVPTVPTDFTSSGIISS